MSADDGYCIRRHPEGGFAAVHYSASSAEDYGYPEVNLKHHAIHPSIEAAVASVMNDWTEYGVTIHKEVLK